LVGPFYGMPCAYLQIPDGLLAFACCLWGLVRRFE
jgi:hypothetical protein